MTNGDARGGAERKTAVRVRLVPTAPERVGPHASPCAGLLDGRTRAGFGASGFLRRSAVEDAAGADGRDSELVPPLVSEILRSPGEPLGEAVRARVEPGFSRDFSAVRVHADARAAASAEAVGARAYAVGRDIVFGAGRYRPDTADGAALLAHELAHVVQSGAAAMGSSRLEIGRRDDPQERQAESAARAVAAGRPAGPLPTDSAPVVRRLELPSWQSIRQRGYEFLISGLRGLQQSGIARLRRQVADWQGTRQTVAHAIIAGIDVVLDVLISLVLAIVGIAVGFGTGIVEMIVGLVRLIVGAMQGVLLFLYGFLDQGEQFDRWANGVSEAISQLIPNLRRLADQWWAEFQVAPPDMQGVMIGELTGQILALLATIEFSAGRIGTVAGRAAGRVAAGLTEAAESLSTPGLVGATAGGRVTAVVAASQAPALAEAVSQAATVVATQATPVASTVLLAVGQTGGPTSAQPPQSSGGQGGRPPRVPPRLARYDARVQRWLSELEQADPTRANQVRASLIGAGDDIAEGINRFWDVSGFREVVANYTAGGNLQQGARFVIRWARANIPNPAGRAISFEMRAMGGLRRLDLFVDGIRYEFKSVQELSESLVRGRGGQFGQLPRDIIANLGDDPTRVAESLRRVRWIFDSNRGLTRPQVVQQLQRSISQSNLFQGHPLLPQILRAIDEIVEFWP